MTVTFASRGMLCAAPVVLVEPAQGSTPIAHAPAGVAPAPIAVEQGDTPTPDCWPASGKNYRDYQRPKPWSQHPQLKEQDVEAFKDAQNELLDLLFDLTNPNAIELFDRQHQALTAHTIFKGEQK